MATGDRDIGKTASKSDPEGHAAWEYSCTLQVMTGRPRLCDAVGLGFLARNRSIVRNIGCGRSLNSVVFSQVMSQTKDLYILGIFGRSTLGIRNDVIEV
jgi:hypothetical protein